jgi:hypothetical protein
LAVFFGQKNSHSLRRALSSKITIILCNLGHKRTVTDSQSKPRAAPVGSACGLKLCAGLQDSAGAIRVNDYTPAHAEQGTLNKVARFARFYRALRISAASRQTKASERCNCQPKKRDARLQRKRLGGFLRSEELTFAQKSAAEGAAARGAEKLY